MTRVTKPLRQWLKAWARSLPPRIAPRKSRLGPCRVNDPYLSSGLRILSWKWDPGVALGFLAVPVLWGCVLGMAGVRTKCRIDRLVLLWGWCRKGLSGLIPTAESRLVLRRILTLHLGPVDRAVTDGLSFVNLYEDMGMGNVWASAMDLATWG